MKQHVVVKIFLSFLSVATGVLFLYSAYAKAFPLEHFEYALVEYVRLPWLFAAAASRTFIGLEAGLGVLFAANIYGRRKWVLKFSMALLIIFSIYLVYLRSHYGDHVNCGCFGDSLWMSPSAALIKNAILLLIIFVLVIYHRGWNNRFTRVFSYSLLAGAVILPFILFMFPLAKPDWQKNGGYMLDMTAIDAGHPTADLHHGKHIVAFVSPTCKYCKLAGYKMHLMKEQDTTLPFYLVLGGNNIDLKSYWTATEAEHEIPWSRMDGQAFVKITGGEFPQIFWLNNGKVEAKTSYIDMKASDIKEWLKR